MNKVFQMWYLLFIYYDFATVVNPFFRAVHPVLETDNWHRWGRLSHPPTREMSLENITSIGL